MSKPTVSKIRDIWIRLLLYPGHTLPTAAAPVLVATGLAARDGLLAPLPLAIAFLGSWLIHVGGVFFDNHELLRRFPRLPEHPELIAALADGSLKLEHLRLAIITCFGLAASTAPYLYAIGGPPVLLLGAIGIAASLSYAGGPVAYNRYGLAEPVFLLMFGVVAVYGSYYIQAAAHDAAAPRWAFFRELPIELLLLGLPVGALVTCVLIVDDIRDRGFDAAKGWRTGTVRFGLGNSRLRFGVLLTAACAAPPLYWLTMVYEAWILLPLLCLPWAVSILATVLRHDTTAELLPITPATSKLSMIYSLLLGVGVALQPPGG